MKYTRFNMEQIKKIESSHILWIDGIKGLSCIFIFLHHFFLGIFPATYYGPTKESHLFGIDTFLSTSPLGIFLNGNFFVFLYIFISGYVITYQTLRMKTADFGIFHFKRYLKLMFPLLVYCFIFFIINKLDKNLLSELTQNNNYSLFMTIKMGFYKILYFNNTTYGGHFWMMAYIFLGGLFASVIAATTWAIKAQKSFIIAMFFTGLLFINLTLCYPTLFLGCAYCIFQKFGSARIEYIKSNRPRIYNFAFWIIFIFSIVLGAYPSGCMPDNFYRFINIPHKPEESYHFYHMIASFMLIAAVMNLPKLQRFFESKVCIKLAKISYTFYIFHGLTQILLKSIFTECNNRTNNYILSAFIYLLVSLSLTIIISYFLTKYVFSPFGAFVNKKVNSFKDEFLCESQEK